MKTVEEQFEMYANAGEAAIAILRRMARGISWIGDDSRRVTMASETVDEAQAFCARFGLATDDGQGMPLRNDVGYSFGSMRGEGFRIEHDGFIGTKVGEYETREGKRGVVLQQLGTRVVHVYGERWLKPTIAPAESDDGEMPRVTPKA